MFLQGELAICSKLVCWVHLLVSIALSLSVEPDSEVEGVRLSFWSRFRDILLIFLDF